MFQSSVNNSFVAKMREETPTVCSHHSYYSTVMRGQKQTTRFMLDIQDISLKPCGLCFHNKHTCLSRVHLALATSVAPQVRARALWELSAQVSSFMFFLTGEAGSVSPAVPAESLSILSYKLWAEINLQSNAPAAGLSQLSVAA